ncbi:MAG: SDR family oxidoreductase [Proteobacteria bacterium]|nr:SDR family oxidoreductase [Pseudomonadota bacterium]
MISKKTIFVTGAASGIGRATAQLFAEKGWFVGLYDLDENGLTELHQRIGQENSCWKKMDVAGSQEVEEAIAHFSERTEGRMDALFNCAGILRMGSFEEIDAGEQRKTVEINLIGIINCIHSSLSMLKRTSDSHIVSMSSMSAVYGTPDLATYSATKFAVNGLTEALNIEFERHGINVSDIKVPYVQTPMLEQDRKAFSIEKAGVNVSPEEVAELVWKAAHGKKVHWSKKVKLVQFILWMLPFTKRTLWKSVSWDK